MAMTAEAGALIRKENSDIESIPCAMLGLTMVTKGKSKTKVDGYSIEKNVYASIKSGRLSSTQVHITTPAVLSARPWWSDESVDFIRRWFTSDRSPVTETEGWQSFLADLNSNSKAILEHIIGIDDRINTVVWFDKDSVTLTEIDANYLVSVASQFPWIVGARNGSFVLKNSNGKSLFHLQRHSKYNPQFHIYREAMSV